MFNHKNGVISIFYKERPVAQLVLRAFVGPPGLNQYLARHLDDNRENNTLENLAWGNDQDNHDDAVKNKVNFVSFGHLGKHHSIEAKAKISKALKGRVGKPMSESHRLAINAGYRKMFPKKLIKSKKCSCSCGCDTLPGRNYIHGHAGRVLFKKIAEERIGLPRSW